MKAPEALDTELVGEEGGHFVLTEQYQQGLQTLLGHLQAKYTAVSEWLSYYLCDSQQKDLFHSEKIHYKAFAEYILARLKLCQEVHPKAIELQALFSPAGWWVNWIASELWWELYQAFQEECGYQGKREWYNLARQASKPYELQHEGNAIPRPQLLPQETDLPAEIRAIDPAVLALFLVRLCASKASTDPTFDHQHYQKYSRAQRAFHNACRNSPQLQIGYVSLDGQLHMSQKDKQVSKSRRR